NVIESHATGESLPSGVNLRCERIRIGPTTPHSRSRLMAIVDCGYVLFCRVGLSRSATYTNATKTGTSIKGPTTPASACPDVAPNVPIATAIASSKLFPAAVNANVVVLG